MMPYFSPAGCRVEEGLQSPRRNSTIFFSGGSLHLRTRMHWIGSMGGYSADPELEQRYRGICPECGANTKVQLLAHKDKLLNFSATQRSYASTEFALHVPGHTGTRKGLFDGVLCGALPLLASDFTPLPFPSVVAYNEFALREMANVSIGEE